MFSKVLVANRGEIAVRAFRAAYELGAATVAVYPFEDRNAVHRIKADEAYLIGERGHPVRAYLDVAEIIRAARESGADAIYPGYGFLSENPELAQACLDAGITFIGPPPDVLELAGHKVRALQAAKAAGIPTLRSTPPSADLDELVAGAEEIGFPVFVKAVAGGGGRGMRRVDDPAKLRESVEAAMREAEGAFGDPTAFIEQAVGRPRHIEVQILADRTGHVMHLFERDCSIQRRHQKVVEIAPAPNISAELREALCADAVAFATSIDYSCAGTVEFLVETEGERAGQHVFIEMNPRIQVEHTVTEEITDVDLVQSQMLIASGSSLADLGLSQETVRINGAALQCRITTEDPVNGFRPDTGTITAYRSAAGAGVRLDGGTVDTGVEISPHFDSMLVKLTCRGRNFAAAVARSRRALAEFRIRGREHQHPVPAGGAGRSGLRRRRRVDRVHRAATRAVDHPRARRPGHPDAALAGRGHGQQAVRRRAHPARSAGQAARRRRPRPALAARLAAAAARAGPGRLRRRPALPRPTSRSPTPRSATRTSPCSPPGCGPRTCCGSRRTWVARCPSCCPSSAGAGPRTTSRSASCRRTRGSGWPCCATTCRGSACRCCSAVATRSATRRTRPRSPPPSWPRRPRSASTSSASSTP